MDMGRDQDYEAIQKVIRRARIQRDVALGGLIGDACALAWRAITGASARLQARVIGGSHA
jgi:hypothetical protein